ncbi:MAG: type 1 glutamine amidotransferase [Nocardioides sp.]
MRALFIQHDHVSPVGPIGARFSERGYDVDELVVVPEASFLRPGVSADFPDPTTYDAIVPMGAPWSVYDHELIGTWTVPELELLRTAQAAQVPVLGICFGGQALATALGGSVEASPEIELGWHVVDTDEPGLVEPGPWFQWHQDRWVAPPGARTLARTRLADQAFVLGHSLAVQFHPELTAAMLAGWLANGGSDYLAAHGFDEGPLVEQTARQAAESEARAHRLVDRFLDQVAQVSGSLSLEHS